MYPIRSSRVTGLQLCTFTRLPVLIQLEDSWQIYLPNSAFRDRVYSLRSNHEMQSQIKAVKAKNWLSKASASQQIGAARHIESESGNPQNCIISKAVNISHNQPETNTSNQVLDI